MTGAADAGAVEPPAGSGGRGGAAADAAIDATPARARTPRVPPDATVTYDAFHTGAIPVPPPLVEPEVPPTTLPLPDLQNAPSVPTIISDLPTFEPVVPPVLLKSGRIAVLPGPEQVRFPACAHPVKPPQIPTMTPTIDGDMTEWAQIPPVTLDRSGDGTLDPGDLLSMRVAADDDNYYFAIDSDRFTDGVFRLDFYKEDPTDGIIGQRQAALAWSIRRDALGSDTADEDPTAPSVPLPPGIHGVNVRGFEVVVSRALIKERFGSSPWSVLPRMQAYGGEIRDWMGAFVVGWPADYGCLVPTPSGKSKLLIMRRTPDLTPEQAEVAYRAMFAAPASVETAIEDAYDYLDTLTVTVATGMQASGLHENIGLMFLSYDFPDPPPHLPLDHFKIAAHEYAHGLNAPNTKYRAQLTWNTEGHSEWALSRATDLLVGPALSQWRDYRVLTTDFVEQEDQLGNVSLDATPWPVSPHDMHYHYAKSQAFHHGLATVLPVKSIGLALRDLTSTDELTVLSSRPDLQATVTQDAWSGWFGKDYAPSIFPRDTLLADPDSDGLFDFQEKAHGTDPSSADGDHDGFSDLFELGAGLDPNKRDAPALLAADGRIEDWKRSAPSLLQSSLLPTSTDPGCKNAPGIVSYGAVFDGDWLLVGVEWDKTPSHDLLFEVGITTPTKRDPFNVQVLRGKNYAVGEDNRIVPLVAPFTGNQTEVYYHRTWLGWGTDVPDHFTIHLTAYYAGASDDAGSETLVGCQTTSDFAPSFLVP